MSNVATDPVVVDDKAAINAVNTNTSSNGNEVRAYDFGGNPLFHSHTGESARLPAFGGEFQPGLYKSIAERKFANPAPLGLSAFALTTFVLSLINLQTRGVTAPNFIIALAFGYGGLVQLLAGMWYVKPFLNSIFKNSSFLHFFIILGERASEPAHTNPTQCPWARALPTSPDPRSRST